jgi:hypothetical protein
MFNISNENSFQSHGSKNYILKSDFLNTTESQNNISKEENNYSNLKTIKFIYFHHYLRFLEPSRI